MQPTYLPWLGYFNLIASVDTFVFLDDVQFDRRSWQSRNRILFNGKAQWLTVPVRHAAQDTLLKDIAIHDEQAWRDKHVASLKHAYAKHPHFAELTDLVPLLQDRSEARLVDLNMRVIRFCAERLALACRFVLASSLGVSGKRSDHLVNLCRAVDCRAYLSPRGSADYIAEDAAFEAAGIPVEFQDFSPPVYPQAKAPEFVSHLSIIDAVANVGWSGARTLVAGREAE
jgi:hypothetical protein